MDFLLDLSKDRRAIISQHLEFFLVAVVLNYVVWIVICLKDIVTWPSSFVTNFLLAEVYETFIETLVLYSFSVAVTHLAIIFFTKGEPSSKRLTLLFFGMFLTNFAAAYIASAVYLSIFKDVGDLFRARIIAVDGTVVSFLSAGIVIIFLNARSEKYKLMNIEAEKQVEIQKQAAIQARLDKLTVEVDPHYVFNCLSTLSGLIIEDPDAADVFLGKFAKTFRYILDNRNNHVMPVQDEYEFLLQYVDMLTYRYEHVNINICDDFLDLKGLLPSMALEMLVENAIKHNVHTSDHQLNIAIFEKDGYICVRNNFNPVGLAEASTKLGLTNIIERYNYLSEREVKVSNDGVYFLVEIPLLYDENLVDDE